MEEAEVYQDGDFMDSEEEALTETSLPPPKGKSLVIVSSHYLEYHDNDLKLSGKEFWCDICEVNLVWH